MSLASSLLGTDGGQLGGRAEGPPLAPPMQMKFYSQQQDISIPFYSYFVIMNMFLFVLICCIESA